MTDEGGRDRLLYLESKITFEEWERRKIAKQTSGATSTSSTTDTVAASVRQMNIQEIPPMNPSTTSESDVSITSVTSGTMPLSAVTIKSEPPECSPPKSSQPSKEDDESEDDDVIYIDTEMTMRYLTGEIPFEEFHAMLERQAEVKEEPVEVDEAVMDVETTPHTDLGLISPEPSTSGEAHKKRNESSTTIKKRPRIKKSRLPRHLQGLMGEANMKFARGEHDEAITMCMEIIRIAPTASEPFHTLGLIYEEQGDAEKTLQFLLIAAHLQQDDPDEWERLAEMSLEQGIPSQAIMCYSKALKYSPGNVLLLSSRCSIYEQLGDNRKVLDGYQQILQALSPNEGAKYMELARRVAASYHTEMNEPSKAISTMATALEIHPECFEAGDVNLLIELYLSQGIYDKSLEVLIQHCGVSFILPNGEVLKQRTGDQPPLKIITNMPAPVSCSVPDETPVDLRVKLVVCMAYLKFGKVVQAVAAPLFDFSPEEVGDLYLDVAEAYMETDKYEDARPILHSLVNSQKYNLAAVWLRYGECLKALGELQSAVHAYQHVVELAPAHLAARVSLSALQQQLGRHCEALEALQYVEDQDQEVTDTLSQKLDVRLMLPRCLLLYSQEKYDEFIESCKQVLFGSFKDIFTKKHMSVILANRSRKHRTQAMRHVLGSKMEQNIKEAASLLNDTTITVEDLWELYLKMCRVMIDKEQLEELQDVTIVALMSPLFMNDSSKAVEADFICMTACLLSKNGHFAYNFIREICIKELNNNRAWNVFCQIIILSQDIRHNRFCLRLMMKHPNHLALGILNGHNAMVAGTYKHALGEYVAAFRQEPWNPMMNLCIGLTFIHMASQKFASKRHSLTIQASAFLNQYLELRGECQESYYNLGRAMHQIGLLPTAVFYYRKALTFPSAITGPEQEIFDLSNEIAFNLVLIYRNSGSDDLATMIMQKYMVV